MGFAIRMRTARHGQLRLQDVTYLAAQGVDREWLGQQLDIRIEQAMMDNGITGIAGCVEDFESWRTGARLLGKPVAVHSRQADISQENGNFRVRFKNPQSGNRLPCL